VSFRVEYTTEIEAPAELVWQVLTDFAAYPEWNPFVREASGTFEVGEVFQLEVRLGEETWKVKQKIISLIPGYQYAWTSRSWYVLLATWGLRTFNIESLGPNRCRFVDAENTYGPLAFVVKARYGEALNEGLSAAGEALKARAEGLTVAAKGAS